MYSRILHGETFDVEIQADTEDALLLLEAELTGELNRCKRCNTLYFPNNQKQIYCEWRCGNLVSQRKRYYRQEWKKNRKQQRHQEGGGA